MKNVNLAEAFREFKDYKNVDRSEMKEILEEAIKASLLKIFGVCDNFDIIINLEKGDLEIWQNRTVVSDGNVVDKILEISLSDAKKIDDSYEEGEDVAVEVRLVDFGRRAVLALRQNLASKMLEIEKKAIFDIYINRVGDVIIGEVYQIWKKEILIIDDLGNELIMPSAEQIPNDYFKKGESCKAIIHNVEMKNGSPVITLSRSSPLFLERLLEQEVPEIQDKVITIKKIVRMPGRKAKVSVESYDERIDPVGSCVGVRGSRIFSIVKELRNENIDVINYSTKPLTYIQRAMSVAKESKIVLDENLRKATVFLNPDQISKAIGQGGSNIKLAMQLTGYDIDIYRIGENEENLDDVHIDEFSDEIDGWIIDVLKSIGCDTARSVVKIPFDELVKRTDLEEETVKEILTVLNMELNSDNN